MAKKEEYRVYWMDTGEPFKMVLKKNLPWIKKKAKMEGALLFELPGLIPLQEIYLISKVERR